MLYAIIVFLLLIIAWGAYHYFQKDKQAKDAEAREQGLDEIEEGYQAEIMDLEDKLEAARRTNAQLNSSYAVVVDEYDTQIAELQQRELHSQEHIVQLKARLTDAQQAGLEMQQRLVSHEEDCLPHINLSDDVTRVAEWEKEIHDADEKSDHS